MAKKVLLVDDEESVRLSLGFWLRRNQFEVTLCASAADARAALAAAGFDFVISDFRLSPGGEDGLELLREARRANPGTRCVLLTATPADELPAALREADLASLYQKPVDVFELLRLLRAPLATAAASPTPFA